MIEATERIKYKHFNVAQIRIKRKAGVPEWLKNEKKS
tara:strand:- start:157 stop:267 length:111 start_codon:yes stop_codon:yes gene_type:complete